MHFPIIIYNYGRMGITDGYNFIKKILFIFENNYGLRSAKRKDCFKAKMIKLLCLCRFSLSEKNLFGVEAHREAREGKRGL